MTDPIVDEVRKYRDEHSKLFNYDLDEICNDYHSKHQLFIEKLKKIKKRKIANK